MLAFLDLYLMQNSLQLIRNATLKIHYNNLVILIDPMLSEPHQFESFANKSKNPIVDLPVSPAEVLDQVGLVIITHQHVDHFDSKAKFIIDKKIQIFTQECDMSQIQNEGFTKVSTLNKALTYKGIKFQKTQALHGKGELGRQMGKVFGCIISAENLPKLYIVGDSVLTETVLKTIESEKPDYIIINAGGAEFPHKPSENIIMNANETETFIKSLNYSTTVIAVHLEALDHCLTSRQDLKAAVAPLLKDSVLRFIIPEDGETITLQ